jgi:hypothetical protein
MSSDWRDKYVNMQKRLDAIFWYLWGDRNGIPGAFMGSVYRDHPSFIKRGQLLLKGYADGWSGFWVIPEDVTLGRPVNSPACINMGAMPPTFRNGECIPWADALIRVSDADGPWWQALADELPQMEAQVAQRREALAAAEEAKENAARLAREHDLQQAAVAVTASTMRTFQDGDKWCAVYPDFVNVQESPCGFGDTPEEARSALAAGYRAGEVRQ